MYSLHLLNNYGAMILSNLDDTDSYCPKKQHLFVIEEVLFG